MMGVQLELLLVCLCLLIHFVSGVWRDFSDGQIWLQLTKKISSTSFFPFLGSTDPLLLHVTLGTGGFFVKRGLPWTSTVVPRDQF